MKSWNILFNYLYRFEVSWVPDVKVVLRAWEQNISNSGGPYVVLIPGSSEAYFSLGIQACKQC